jgi:nitrile hydratase accessory protein
LSPSKNKLHQSKKPDPVELALIPNLPIDEDGPVFAEPWQAQAFAMAVNLSGQGYFSWSEWAEVLAAELQRAADRSEADDGSHYYHHWVAALEKLVTQKGLADSLILNERKNSWADAYRSTPHGQPVSLENDL